MNKQRWRIFTEYYRPELEEGNLFFGIDERCVLDYAVYFFRTSNIESFLKNNPVYTNFFINKNLLETKLSHYVLFVYRGGQRHCIRRNSLDSMIIKNFSNDPFTHR